MIYLKEEAIISVSPNINYQKVVYSLTNYLTLRNTKKGIYPSNHDVIDTPSNLLFINQHTQMFSSQFNIFFP